MADLWPDPEHRMFPIPRAKLGSSIGHYTDDLSDRDERLDELSFPDDINHMDSASSAGVNGRPSWMNMLENSDVQNSLRRFSNAFANKGLTASTLSYGMNSRKNGPDRSFGLPPLNEIGPFFTLPESIASYSIDGDKHRYVLGTSAVK